MLVKLATIADEKQKHLDEGFFLNASVADPDPVPFDPGIWDPGWVKSQDPDPE